MAEKDRASLSADANLRFTLTSSDQTPMRDIPVGHDCFRLFRVDEGGFVAPVVDAIHGAAMRLGHHEPSLDRSILILDAPPDLRFSRSGCCPGRHGGR